MGMLDPAFCLCLALLLRGVHPVWTEGMDAAAIAGTPKERVLCASFAEEDKCHFASILG